MTEIQKGFIGLLAVAEYWLKIPISIILYYQEQYQAMVILLILGTMFEVFTFSWILKGGRRET